LLKSGTVIEKNAVPDKTNKPQERFYATIYSEEGRGIMFIFCPDYT
jgi:hypothetical protein